MYRVFFFAIISLLAISIGCSSGGWGYNQPAYPIGPYPQTGYPQTGYPPQNYQNSVNPGGGYPVGNQQLPSYTGVPTLQPGQQPGYGQPITGQLPIGSPNYGQPILGGIPQGGVYPNNGYPGGYYPQNQGVPLNTMSPSAPWFGR